MNVMSVLNQLMNQASGGQPGSAGSGGSGGDLLGKLGSQLGGGQGSGGTGIDMKSLLGGGALGLLLGSRRGRKMGGKALKYGALAGVGVLAWKAWQNSQAGAGQAAAQTSTAGQGQPLEELQGQAQERRGLEILQAMIMAARADGHIDSEERALLGREIERLGPDDELQAWIQQQFDAPLDAAAVARSADSPQARREIYLVSAAIIDEQNPMERAWLDQLAAEMALEPALVRELDRQLRAS